MSVRLEGSPLPRPTPTSPHNRALGGLAQLRQGLSELTLHTLRGDHPMLDNYAQILAHIEQHVLDHHAAKWAYARLQGSPDEPQ